MSERFESSKNKDCIRTSYDLPIVRAFSERVAHPLSYLGLPGEKILDLIAWRSQLSGEVTAVEWGGRTAKQRLQASRVHASIVRLAAQNGLRDIQILIDSIESVIEKGVSQIGTPIKSYQVGRHIRFRYDLINLDFCGGTTEERRVNLKRLFERQAGTPFLLLLSFSVRSPIADEHRIALSSFVKSLEDGPAKTWVERHVEDTAGLEAQRLSVVIPLAVDKFATAERFDCHCYPPVWYDGSGDPTPTRMVHFAFRLLPLDEHFVGTSVQSTVDRILVPLFTATNGLLVLDSAHPTSVALRQHGETAETVLTSIVNDHS